jgi:proteic killer suppression protein
VIRRVILSARVKKELRKVPRQVVDKMLAWVQMIERLGLEETQKVPGFHDEPLKGERKGQRSVRLNIHYRAIYAIVSDEVRFVEVRELTKHEY